jgi:hypothetical protein
MQADTKLLRLQRRFMAALREPIFDDSRAKSDLPPRTGAVSEDFLRTAAALITPSATMAPVERLELYHRQYWYRLLDSIAEDFPALRRLLGDIPFWRLMEAYLEAAPPRSFTLRHLGAGLADFIAQQAETIPDAVQAEDLARLEYALCASFEAGESAPVEPSDLGQLEIALQPHVLLLALQTPADTLWRASEGGRRPRAPRSPGASPSRFLAVYRHNLVLHVERLPRAAFSILSAIRDLHSLDLAMERVSNEPRLLRPKDAGRIGQWFGTWTARAWFCRHPPEQRDKPTPSKTPRT